MFRLPSEKSFLFGGMDYNDLFGRRKGINHAPHIRSQLDLDTNLCFGAVLFFVGMLYFEPYKTHKYTTLRENMRMADMGYFEEEDFKN